jgi:hypothetical protein
LHVASVQLEEDCKVECLKEWHAYKVRANENAVPDSSATDAAAADSRHSRHSRPHWAAPWSVSRDSKCRMLSAYVTAVACCVLRFCRSVRSALRAQTMKEHTAQAGPLTTGGA